MGVFLPFLAIPVLLWLGDKKLNRLRGACIAFSVAILGCFLILLGKGTSGQSDLTQFTYDWVPALGISFTLWAAPFSLFFALLVSGIGLMVIIYGIGYLEEEPKQAKFFAYLFFFMGAMLGMASSADLITLFVFWELTSISSFLLIGFKHKTADSRMGAQTAFLVTLGGSLAMFVGIILFRIDMMAMNIAFNLGIPVGDLMRFDVLYENVANLQKFWASSGSVTLILVLLLGGAFTKSAQAPFHIWLPGAMEAPTPVSAYLHSATMVKAGLFLAARILPIFAVSGTWFILLGIGGLLSFALGAVLAFFAKDIKALLAYTTISQLGLIMACYGHATFLPNQFDVYHILNHAAYKAPLFMVAGILTHVLHTREIGKMRGLGKAMPITCLISIIAGFSMMGFPLPISGFVSKELFLKGVWKLYWEKGYYSFTEVLLAVGGAAFIVATTIRFVHGIFFSAPLDHGAKADDEHHHEPHDPSPWLALPALCIALLTVLIGLRPGSVEHFFEHSFHEVGGLHSAFAAGAHPFAYWHGISMPLIMSLTALVSGIAIYVIIPKLSAKLGTITGEATNSLSQESVPAKIPIVKRLAATAYAARPSYWVKHTITEVPNWASRLNHLYLRGDLLVYMLISFGVFALTGILFVSSSYGLTQIATDIGQLFWTDRHVMVGWSSLLMAGAMALGVSQILASKQRFAMVLIASVTGYLTTLFYVIYLAPDLALTQLLVETVSITLFLITFRLLPTFQEEDSRPPLGLKRIKLTVSVGAGIAAFCLTWMTVQSPLAERISTYFLANTVVGTGGQNTVNTILVDFRAYDTLGEIVVLVLAMIGASVLLSRRAPKPPPKLPGVEIAHPD